MKKYISKILTSLALVLGLSANFLFSSCDGVIFYEIRNEVALDDAEIGGDIQNIIRYNYNGTECIFIANGEIKYRSVEDDVVGSKISFSTLSGPSGYIYSLAADGKNLYAMAVTIEEDDDGYNTATQRTLWCFDGSSSSWSTLWTAAYSSVYAFVFCTNSPTTRKAYFRYGSCVWELSSSLDTSTATYLYQDSNSSSVITTGAPAEADTSKTLFYPLSCTVLGSTVYFSSSYAMTSNETASENSTYIYYSSGDNVYYKSTSDSGNVDLSCDTIISLAVTENYLLAGTEGGIVHTPLSSNVPSSGNADFSTNAASTLSSYYEIPAVLAIDPGASELGGTIYATSITSSSSASRKNVGLWSYYASEGEWNRE